MQLILNTETDIGIQRKMSAIEQESLDEKFINKTLADQVNDEIPNINEDCIENFVEENENEDCVKVNLVEENENGNCVKEKLVEENENEDCVKINLVEENENEDCVKENLVEENDNDDCVKMNLVEENENEDCVKENLVEQNENDDCVKENLVEQNDNDDCVKENLVEQNDNDDCVKENLVEQNENDDCVKENSVAENENEDCVKINLVEENENEDCVIENLVEQNENDDCVKENSVEENENEDCVKINLVEQNENDDCVKENLVEQNENEDFKNNEDTSNDYKNISSKCLLETRNKDCIENTDATDLPMECNEQNKNDDITNIIIEDEEPDNTDIVLEINKKETELQLSENENSNVNGKTQEEQEKIKTDIIKNTADKVDAILEETNDKLDEPVAIEMETENNKEVVDDSVLNGEVISISDDKEEECITLMEQEVSDEEVKSETSLNDVSNNITSQSADNDIYEDQKIHDCNTQGLVNIESDLTNDSSSVKPITENIEVNQFEEMLKDTNLINDNGNETVTQQVKTENKNTNNNIKDTKKFSHICKLSNTLDILSDEEEEPIEKESQNNLRSSDVKQCINIDDDDDIMLIDDQTNVKDEKNNSSNVVDTKIDVKETDETPKIYLLDTEPIENKEELNVLQGKTNISETDLNKIKEEEKAEENKPIQKPLLPVNFLKTCKKNLADMTRDELEEFCILKIVESVVDRSNLSEIKMKLKTLGQNIEEYKKKAMLLTKQNRDLQVVLKSVQEEQKKKSDIPITPLKITRSVGMQVFMADKIGVRRKSVINNMAQNNVTSNNNANRIKTQLNQSPKPLKPQTNTNNTQQIPVPRLVPAVNNASNNKLQTPITMNSTITPVTTTLPNGIRNSPPTPKPEKRPHSKMQQGNSVTVDLTDDEPPTKVLQRIVNPPVRLISPQNLLAPQRQPFGTNISSPRKVYIPISGSQNQVRPGQTIMLRPIAPQGPRLRMPNILPKPNPNTNAVRMTRITRHPAPLPDSMKQYQPPNWKALPPAPELKLSKVDNGIVISWKIDGYKEENQEKIASYQLFAYQETSSPPSTALWKKIGDVKALPLPMACTLTQFLAGYKYYFAVRAVDIRSRFGPFSNPGSILLLNKM